MKKSILFIIISTMAANGALLAAVPTTATKLTAYLKKSPIETQKNYESRLRALATALYWEVAELDPATGANNTTAVYMLEAKGIIQNLIIASFKSLEPVLTDIVDNAPAIGVEFPELVQYYNEPYHQILDKLPKSSKFFGDEKRVLPRNLG